VSEGLFPGGPLEGLSKIFVGGPEVVKYCFFLLETIKQLFFAEIKSRGAKTSTVLLFDIHDPNLNPNRSPNPNADRMLT